MASNRIITGFILFLICLGIPFVCLNAAPAPIPLSKPFVVKTTPMEAEEEPGSFSHKMIIVLPETKPGSVAAADENINEQDETSFADVLSSAVKDEKTGYILPPALPEWKRLAANPSVPAQPADMPAPTVIETAFVDGLPIPGRKPYNSSRIRNTDGYVSISEMATVKARNKELDERQAGSRIPSAPPPSALPDMEDDRMASAPQRTASIERTYANVPKLKETKASSPFKTARAQKAARPQTGDPIILFFQENSPDLEVGQIGILQEDVIDALKRQPGTKATIYGFAAKSRNNPEDSRRLAMSRAMMIREYMVGKRIDSDRLDLETVTEDSQGMPNDRVDIILHR